MIKRSSWLDVLAGREGGSADLGTPVREALARLDQALFEVWNLGANMILAWTREGRALRFLAVRHYAIIEAFDLAPAAEQGADAHAFINGILAGQKCVAPLRFDAIVRALGASARVVSVDLAPDIEPRPELISSIVTRYGVSLVRERAVVLLDVVGFSLRTPLEQVAMLNSLGYSVNSAYRQLLSQDVEISFARTTTGDGFYIWNRARTIDANIALYKLMMLVLADNAVARRKAARFPVPTLRAAFHVGEHYEFYQVEGLNPTTFGYIVGQVTIDLARMVEGALPGQILLGEFELPLGNPGAGDTACGTLAFVEKTADTLGQLKGLVIADDHIEDIRCYLTGEIVPGGGFRVNRYAIRDKHGMAHPVYNAKINIHPRRTKPILLGFQHKALHPAGGQSPIWP